MRFLFIFCLLLAVALLPARAQLWGTVEGSIVASDTGESLPGVTVLVAGTNFGTATNGDGIYVLRMPNGRYRVRISTVGFETRFDSVRIRHDAVARLDVTLSPSTMELDEVTIEESRVITEAGVFQISPAAARDIPTPMRDVVRVLKVLPGVVTNNELSNQVSVRGGGFNENLFFIDGFEVYLPFRPRQGEQEGLSLLNADLASGLTFYSGGFPARYGGKLSSALEVTYRESTGSAVTGSAHASLLDAGLSAGSAVGRFSWLAGLRSARARSFFASQELKGDYDPLFVDGQMKLKYLGRRGWSAELLGIAARHRFSLNPDARRTFFGTISQNSDLAPSNLQSAFISYDAGNDEQDGYDTGFVGARITIPVRPGFRVSHNASWFSTIETERFDLSGTAILFLVDPGEGNPQPGAGLFPAGTSRQEDAADNRVAVRTLSAGGLYHVAGLRHAVELGWQLKRQHFDDRIDEKSVVSGRSLDGLPVRIVADSLRDAAVFDATRAAIHVQDSWSVSSRASLTGGLRADWFSFNDEWTVSPRLSLRYQAAPGTLLLASWGIYYQSSTYRELRGVPEPGETILGAVNSGLRSQRAQQLVGGVEYFVPRLRFVLRSELYAKWISRAISYNVDNVRVEYSGRNDASATLYGLDLQLRGEFVPGLESWVNYSFLVARERFVASSADSVPRPTDQRHTFSLYLQDYIPSDPTWRLHLRTLFGSGLPYTPPIPGPQIGNLVIQAPGDRFSERYPRYFRFDMGVTKAVSWVTRDGRSPVELELTFEILNVFDMTNTVAYSWIPNSSGIWTRIPTRLTPRTFNVRVGVAF